MKNLLALGTALALAAFADPASAAGAGEPKERPDGERAVPSPRPRSTGEGYRRPPAEELRKRLTPVQFWVTQEGGTEPPFANEYWDNHAEGIYVDVVSGEPLFSSTDKYDSGSGWPSFTRPLEPENIVAREDNTHGMKRIEVRSRHADSHLGHVFGDGPPPSGMRYCINSAALRFVPVDRMADEGYGQYLGLFGR